MDAYPGEDGDEDLSFITAESGRYVLALRRAGPGEGSFSMAVETSSAPTEAERRRARADRLFADGEKQFDDAKKRVGSGEQRDSDGRDAADEARRAASQAYRAAAESYELAMSLYRELGARRGEATSARRLGRLYHRYLQQPLRALRAYLRAMTLFAELGDPLTESTMATVAGGIHRDRGDIEEALALQTRAELLKQAVGDTRGMVATASNIAMLNGYLGNVQEAIEGYRRALDLLAGQGDTATEYRGSVLLNRGQLYRRMGEDEQAIGDIEAALRIGEQLPNARLQAVALTALGRIDMERGDVDRARQRLLLALLYRVRRMDKDPGGLAVTLHHLATAYEKAGFAGSAALLYRYARWVFRRLGQPHGQAEAERRLADLLLELDQTDSALGLYRSAWSRFERLDDPFGRIATLDGMARYHRQNGDLDAAIDAAQKSIQAIEAIRGNAAVRALRRSYLASRQDHYDLLVDLQMERYQRDSRGDDLAAALATAERSRARALAESIVMGGDRAGGSDLSLLERYREAGRELGEIELARWTAHQEQIEDSEEARRGQAVLERRLMAALQEYRRLAAELEKNRPRLAGLLGIEVVDVADMQALLPEDTVLLVYDLGEARSFLWIVTRSALRGVVLPDRDEIDRAARWAHKAMANSHRAGRELEVELAREKLGELLLRPAAPELATSCRVIINADGTLHYVAFAALPSVATGPCSAADAAGSNAAPTSSTLVESHHVTYVPSASVHAALRELAGSRREPTRHSFILADPVFSPDDPRFSPGVTPPARPGRGAQPSRPLERLRFSASEAQAIWQLVPPENSKLALGFEATLAAATGDEIGACRYVHLATHGEIDHEHPEMSRLVFSRFDRDGRPQEGILFAHNVLDMDLAADLVVLSACETGLGAEIPGEGLVGLMHAFLSAGASRVLVSLWEVDDQATAELMRLFYARLLRDGDTPDAALAAAQREIARHPRWRAPYYWAAFVLHGTM